MLDPTLQTVELHLYLDLLKSGDRSALDELLKRSSARLERLARKLMSKFSRLQRWIDAEDVLQNAMLRLIRSLQTVRPQSMREFYGLAAMQIRRELLDLTKSLYGPYGEGTNEDSISSETSIGAIGFEPAAQTEDTLELENWCHLHESVEKLPCEEREVIGLILYHGWSQTKVAELFDVSVRTVQRWWKSGIVRLRSGFSEVSEKLPE